MLQFRRLWLVISPISLIGRHLEKISLTYPEIREFASERRFIAMALVRDYKSSTGLDPLRAIIYDQVQFRVVFNVVRQ